MNSVPLQSLTVLRLPGLVEPIKTPGKKPPEDRGKEKLRPAEGLVKRAETPYTDQDGGSNGGSNKEEKEIMATRTTSPR